MVLTVYFMIVCTVSLSLCWAALVQGLPDTIKRSIVNARISVSSWNMAASFYHALAPHFIMS